MWRSLFTSALMICPALFAQSPVIVSVVNEKGDPRLSPGMVATVRGANLAASEPAVTIGGIPAELAWRFHGDDDADTQFGIRLPSSLPVGPASLVVTTEGGSSPPFSVNIRRYSPEFISPTFQRSPNPNGLPEQFVNDCFVGQDTVSPGDILFAYAIGLESPDPGSTPALTVGNVRAEVVESAIVGAGYPGWYQVTFRVPPGDGIFPVTLAMPGETSRPTMLPVGNVKGWSFLGLHRGAPESMVFAQSCGPFLADIGASYSGDPRNPPGILGGVTVKVKDSAGVERTAPLMQLDCCSLTFVIPAGTAPGLATVTETNSRGSMSGYLDVQAVYPLLPLISGSRDGQPYVSGCIVRVRQGAQSVEPVAALLPIGAYGLQIDMGPDTDEVYLVLLGTGLRHRSSLAGVRAVIDGIEIPVSYAGPQSEVAGVDQVNMKLPRSLAGHGGATL
jgi:uncharacterized protein (TIGR03437 family)